MFVITEVVGLKTFHREMRRFSARERVEIVQKSLRAGLRPGISALKKATPRTVGKDHAWVMLRKAMHGYPTVPAHAADAAAVSVKKFPNSVVGALWYKKGFDWYLYFLSTGFKHVRSGKFIAAKDFATAIVAERKKYMQRTFPDLLARQIEYRLKSVLRKKGK